MFSLSQFSRRTGQGRFAPKARPTTTKAHRPGGLFLIFLCTCAPPPATTFPATEWATATPAAVGIDPAVLDSTLAYLATHCREDGLEEVLVIRHGKVVWAGDSIDRVHDIWSCTKSFTGAAAGLLIEEGKIGLDQPAADHEPLLRERYPTVTYRHFLTMTSGYDAVGDSRWGEASRDWSRTPYEPAPPLFAPGTAYAYWDEAMIIAGRALTRAAGESLNDYLDERLFQKIGIQRREWWGEGYVGDSVKINFGGTGLKMSASEQARFGLLYLNGGRWKGEQIVPEEWVLASTGVQVPADLPVAATDRATTDGTGTYGYNWWIIPSTDEYPRAAYTSGLNHNVCLIVPDWDFVLVRMGTDGNPEVGKQVVYTEVVRRLAAGVL
jgi:CubicO group peptidase (beta-lactamase class C family)